MHNTFSEQGWKFEIDKSSTMKNVSYFSYSAKKWRQDAKVL